jgi:DNA repair exonuclease SbcCD nuclease subunit
MIRILHLADLHLGWKPSFLSGEKQLTRQRERDNILKKAVEFAINPSNNIDMVIIAGDLFETHKPEEALARDVIMELKKLEARGIYLITVPGNHDEISYHDSVYRKNASHWPGLLVKNPMPALAAATEIKGIPIWIYSMAYTGGLTKTNNLGRFPREVADGLHIGVFHGSLDWDAGERSLPIRSQELAQGDYSYVALGHIHKYQEAKIGNGLAVYSGAVDHKSFSDPGVGHFTIAALDGHMIKIEKIPVDTRIHKRLEIDTTTVHSVDALISNLRCFGCKELLAQVVIKGTPPFAIDPELLLKLLEPDFFHLSIKDKSNYIDSAYIEFYMEEPTIRGQFVKRLVERMANAPSDRNKEVLRLAIIKGLEAFQGGSRG